MRGRAASCLNELQDVSSWLLVVLLRGFSTVFHLVLSSGGLETAIAAFGHPGDQARRAERATNFLESTYTFNSCCYRGDA